MIYAANLAKLIKETYSRHGNLFKPKLTTQLQQKKKKGKQITTTQRNTPQKLKR